MFENVTVAGRNDSRVLPFNPRLLGSKIVIEPFANLDVRNSHTSLSLLERAKSNDATAWSRLCDLYAPLIHQWCRQRGVRPEDLADVGQDVFLAVSRDLAKFSRDGEGQSFRAWLRTITEHRIIDHARSHRRSPRAVGGSDVTQQMAEVPFEKSLPTIEVSEDQETTILYRKALTLIENEFPDWYKTAFLRIVINEEDSTLVAEELRRKPSAIYNMKARVLRRLRDEFTDVIS